MKVMVINPQTTIEQLAMLQAALGDCWRVITTCSSLANMAPYNAIMFVGDWNLNWQGTRGDWTKWQEDILQFKESKETPVIMVG